MKLVDEHEGQQMLQVGLQGRFFWGTENGRVQVDYNISEQQCTGTVGRQNFNEGAG
jgi:hypothetical protein